MVTLSTDCQVPYEVMKPILLEAAVDLRSLSIYREVSKEFKTVADSPSFLHALLVKLKGDQYSDILYAENPKNFFYTERDLLRSMKKHEKLQSISSIGLRSLALRSFFLSSGHYFRFSIPCMEALRTVDCRDQGTWNACIEEMTEELTKFEFPFQWLCTIHSQCIPTYQKIESVYNQPNAIMQRLIKDLALTDMYFAEPHMLIVQTETKPFDPSMLEEAIMEPQEYKKMITIEQIKELIEGLKICVLPGNPPRVHFGLPEPRRKEIADQLQDGANLFLKPHVESFLTSDNYRFMLAVLFPKIWPDILREWSKQRQNTALYYWLIYFFSQSIKIENDMNIKCDEALCRFIYDDLKNSRFGFKDSIEKHYKNKPVFNHFTKIFPGIWDDNPTLNPA